MFGTRPPDPLPVSAHSTSVPASLTVVSPRRIPCFTSSRSSLTAPRYPGLIHPSNLLSSRPGTHTRHPPSVETWWDCTLVLRPLNPNLLSTPRCLCLGLRTGDSLLCHLLVDFPLLFSVSCRTLCFPFSGTQGPQIVVPLEPRVPTFSLHTLTSLLPPSHSCVQRRSSESISLLESGPHPLYEK